MKVFRICYSRIFDDYKSTINDFVYDINTVVLTDYNAEDPRNGKYFLKCFTFEENEDHHGQMKVKLFGATRKSHIWW